MKNSEAWQKVSDILTANFSALPLYLDDNPEESITLTPNGAAILRLQSGYNRPYASPGVTSGSLVFTVKCYFPSDTVTSLQAMDYADSVCSLFTNQTLLTLTGDAGALICTRTQSDILGLVPDGRSLYLINVNVVFDNFTYS